MAPHCSPCLVCTSSSQRRLLPGRREEGTAKRKWGGARGGRGEVGPGAKDWATAGAMGRQPQHQPLCASLLDPSPSITPSPFQSKAFLLATSATQLPSTPLPVPPPGPAAAELQVSSAPASASPMVWADEGGQTEGPTPGFSSGVGSGMGGCCAPAQSLLSPLFGTKVTFSQACCRALPCLLLLLALLLLPPLCLFALGWSPPSASPVFVNPLPKPPMGWNSWNHYGCNITETIIRETADSLVSTGLASAGYTYLNIDDCWQDVIRDDEGRLMPDPVTFPSGIKALADYVHSKGLKFGVYSDAGYHTCAGRMGSLGYEELDAQTFASWGVDYLKYDNCSPGTVTQLPFLRYKTMGDALIASGRRIVYSMCEWGTLYPALWAKALAHADLWRTTLDIENNWSSMMSKATENNAWAQYAGPGGWNDPDMLEVGNGNLTAGESRVQMALWAIMKSPLLIGCDIRNMTDTTKGILMNPEVIAVNQDSLGVQGRKVATDDASEIWAGPLSGGRVAVALVNKSPAEQHLSLDLWTSLRVQWARETYSVRDVWKATTLTAAGNSLGATVGPHDVALLILRPNSASL